MGYLEIEIACDIFFLSGHHENAKPQKDINGIKFLSESCKGEQAH